MGDSIVISNMTDDSISKAFLFPYKEKHKILPEIHEAVFYISYDSVLDIIMPDSIEPPSESFLTMLASEDVLKKDWDNPIEDEAWAHL